MFQDLFGEGLYAYGNNNPYRYRDPDGKTPLAIARVEFGLVFALATRLGAATLGAWISEKAWNALHSEAENSNANAADKPQASPTTPAGDKTDTTGAKGSAGGARAGKPFTPKGKAEIDAENAGKNGGVNVCENCGVGVVPGKK